ncbi:ATP-binding protein [Deinococcus apachensis]|uniref:ATP-binding protein n=1 Tax=Deinococcus apachensis TaxID=309886 RepID=UPI000364C413|nr:ATP-binding protein [Deinococcus apachensis]
MRSELQSGLIRGLGAVRSRRVGVALGLWGEPGIGKTFLADMVMGDLGCAGHRAHATQDFGALALALPRTGRLPTWAGGQLARLARGERLDPAAGVNTLAAVLSALAPFVLHLEDLHEAEAEQHAQIAELAGAVKRSPGVGLLVTSRSEPPAPFTGYHLRPLDGDELVALLRGELGAELPGEAAAWITGRTHGNPLFALEFLRYLSRQGFLWSDGQRWHWRAPAEGFVPVTVEALIGQLCAGAARDPDERAALEARALLPASLEAGPLEAVWGPMAGLTPGALDQARRRLEAAGLLRGDHFAHPLFGEVIARELTGERRQRLARRALPVLARVNPLLAAEFLEAAQVPDAEALALLEQAAAQATAAGQGVQAGRLLARSLAWRGGPERARVALEAARLLYDTEYGEVVRLLELSLQADPDNVEALYFLAEWRLLERGGQAPHALLAHLPETERASARWWAKWIKFHFLAEAWPEVLRLWEAHPEFHPGAPAMTVHDVAFAHLFTGDPAGVLALAGPALERPDLQPLERCDLWNVRACALSEVGELDAALEALGRAIDVAAGEGATVWLSSYLFNRAEVLGRTDHHLDRAIADAEACVRLRVAHGSPYQVAQVQPLLGHLLTLRGDFERAETLLLETRALCERYPPRHALARCLIALAELYLEWDPPHGPVLARRAAAGALELAHTLQSAELLPEALEVNAAAEQRAGHSQAAARLLAEAGALTEGKAPSSGQARLWRRQAELEAEAGRVGAAQALLEQALTLARAQGPVREAQLCGLDLDHLRGDAAGVRERQAWFDARGLGALAARARRLFPQPATPKAPDPPALRLNVLGPPTLERGGQRVVYRGRKRTELLACLLEARLTGRTELSVLDLLDALYPGEPEEAARRTLKQQVYLLREALGAGCVLSTSGGYALGAVSSDAEEFLAGGPATLWRGVYLGGLSEGWQPGVRDALSLALRERVEALLLSNPLEAARLGRVLCQMEPYDQEALRLTISALEAAGEPHAARRFYLERRATLSEVGEVLPPEAGVFVGA